MTGLNPIFLIVGPPAVGKSTTSHALAAYFPRSIHIPVDDLRHMVVSGLALPGAIWSNDLIQQVSLARGTVAQMAARYRDAGYAVVIDDFWDSNHQSDYAALADQAYLHRIVLYPDQQAAHQRNQQRSGEGPARGYLDDGIRDVYRHLNPVVAELRRDGWLIVDTTTLTVDATVRTILEHSGVEA